MKLERILTHYLDRSDAARETNKTRARCKRKAAKLGVKIEIDRSPAGNGYWLEGTGWDDENYCGTWDEVESKLDQLAEGWQ